MWTWLGPSRPPPVATEPSLTARECKRSSWRSPPSLTPSMSASGAPPSGTRHLPTTNAVDPLGHGSTFWMQELDPDKPLRHAMHVDVSVAREQVEARVAAALAAGGRIVDESNAPAHWTLADSAGNRVCICAWPDGAVEPEV